MSDGRRTRRSTIALDAPIKDRVHRIDPNSANHCPITPQSCAHIRACGEVPPSLPRHTHKPASRPQREEPSFPQGGSAQTPDLPVHREPSKASRAPLLRVPSQPTPAASQPTRTPRARPQREKSRECLASPTFRAVVVRSQFLRPKLRWIPRPSRPVLVAPRRVPRPAAPVQHRRRLMRQSRPPDPVTILLIHRHQSLRLVPARQSGLLHRVQDEVAV